MLHPSPHQYVAHWFCFPRRFVGEPLAALPGCWRSPGTSQGTLSHHSLRGRTVSPHCPPLTTECTLSAFSTLLGYSSNCNASQGSEGWHIPEAFVPPGIKVHGPKSQMWLTSDNCELLDQSPFRQTLKAQIKSHKFFCQWDFYLFQ